jgi:hypothetical protein
MVACLNNAGCSETSSAYYQTHPEIRVLIERHERLVKEVVGPVIVETSAPFFFMALGGTGNFKLGNGFSFQVKKMSESTLIFSKDF